MANTNGKQINLKKFCDPERPGLERPFSLGEWTYAANGHVMVRVPKRNEVAENDKAPIRAQTLFEQFAQKPSYKAAPKFEIPEVLEDEIKTECSRCNGTGREHGCPSCKHKCTFCHGAKTLIHREPRLVAVDGAFFNAKYLAWLQSLPNLKLDRVPRGIEPLRFCFDGGEGMLMPCQPEL